MSLKFEDGGTITPKADTPITCDTHGVTIAWGDLDGIGQQAVKDGIDTAEGYECLLLRCRRKKDVA